MISNFTYHSKFDLQSYTPALDASSASGKGPTNRGGPAQTLRALYTNHRSTSTGASHYKRAAAHSTPTSHKQPWYALPG